jgi:hypothetical protein
MSASGSKLTLSELEDAFGDKFDQYNALAKKVMDRLEIPKEIRGIKEEGLQGRYTTGEPFTFEGTKPQGGANSRPGRQTLEGRGPKIFKVTKPGINVDAAVLDDNFLPFASWKNATIEQRMEASHGADVISVNMRTGEVTLWDAKFRSANVAIQPSPTFAPNSPRLQNAINEAITTIQNNQALPASVRQAALRNLQQGNVTTRTVGFGNAQNSTLR